MKRTAGNILAWVVTIALFPIVLPIAMLIAWVDILADKHGMGARTRYGTPEGYAARRRKP